MKRTMTMALLLALIASSFVLMENASAQSIPKPSVPEFTLKYADYSHSVPPTYGTDPYTGKSIITAQGHEIVNRTVYFTIKNQPFTPFVDSTGSPVNLYYHIRYKGHYDTSWHSNSRESDGETIFYDTLVFPASNATYTEISVVCYLVDGASNYAPLNYVLLPDEGSIDFQVQAIIGMASEINIKTTYYELAPFYGVRGQIGDWSSTQTITIGEISNTPNPPPTTTSPNPTLETTNSPTETPQSKSTEGEFYGPVIVTIVASVAINALLVVIVALLLKKRRKS